MNGFGYKIMVQQISSGSNPLECYVYIDNDPNAPTSATTMREKPYVKQVFVGADNSARRLKGGTMCYKPFGVTKMHYYNDDYYSALFSANPTRQAYLHVCFLAGDSTPTVSWIIGLKYYVTLYDQKEFSAGE